MDDVYYCTVTYKDEGLESSFLRFIPSIRKIMRKVHMKAYSEYADICNGGLIDKLNEEFHKTHTDDWTVDEYNKWMTWMLNTSVIPHINKNHGYGIMKFYVSSNDFDFVGAVGNVRLSFGLDVIE